MRPIRLELTAFGPYLERTVIDFEKLNEAGLFLITGQTGGGKTTLLDAISIALFCKSTGGRRTFPDMRCLAADDDDRTEVTYIFALGDEIYRFRRALYRRKKRGSDAYITEDENECSRRAGDDWELLVTGAARNVTNYAEKLLSLTAEQFSQVIVLPQGKFMQLLRANSTEKAVILKTLFSCELWDRAAIKFSERQKALKLKRETCETKLNSLLEKHNVPTAEALAVQGETLKAERRKTQQALLTSQKALETAQAQYTRALKYEQCVKAEADAVLQVKTAEERLAAAEKQHIEITKKREALPALNDERKALIERAERLRTEQKSSAEKAQLEKDLNLAEQNEKAILRRIEENKVKLPELEKRIGAGEEYTLKCGEAKDRLPGLIQAQNDLKNKIDAVKKRKDTVLLLTQCEESAAKAKKAAENAKNAVTAQEKAITAAEAKRSQNSAAALAVDLKDGVPCPVCGAVHHPSPAAPCEGALTKEELDALRAELGNLRKAQSMAEASFARAEERAANAKKELETANSACTDIAETEEELAAAFETVKKTHLEAQSLADKSAAAQAKLEKLKQELDDLKKSESRNDTALAACRGASEEKRSRLAALKDVRPAEAIAAELKTAQRRFETLGQEIETLDTAFNRAEAVLAAAREAVKTAKTQLQTAKEAKSALGEAPEKDLARSKAELDTISAQTQALSVQLGRAESDLRSVTESLEAVRKYAAEAETLDKQFSRAARLASYVSGKNALRVPLLQYVLGMMLDETIASANVFFSVLSRGRYALQHKQSQTGTGAGYSGLDIEVLDGMTGTCRSVETLSGGEQFLASLSLAFGLSNVVQNCSGAVRLDSIFIDEGFGSLDADTLDTAMRALESIRRSGRIVGIISHVSELQSRIPTMIRITKTASGSAAAEVISED